MCVCTKTETMRERRRTDGWRTSVLEHKHVWHLHTSCSMNGWVCGEIHEEFLLCLRAEQKNRHREGWERQVTYPVSRRREALGKRKGTCHALGTTGRSISPDFGGYWIRLRTTHELVLCEGVAFPHSIYPNFSLERMQHLHWKWVTFESALQCHEYPIVRNLPCHAINLWRKMTSDSWLEIWSRYLALPGLVDFNWILDLGSIRESLTDFLLIFGVVLIICVHV